MQLTTDENGTTAIPRIWFTEPKVSLGALGLLVELRSYGTELDGFSAEGLAAGRREGLHTVRKCLRELETAGYLVRTRIKTGKEFTGIRYTIIEDPEA